MKWNECLQSNFNSINQKQSILIQPIKQPAIPPIAVSFSLVCLVWLMNWIQTEDIQFNSFIHQQTKQSTSAMAGGQIHSVILPSFIYPCTVIISDWWLIDCWMDCWIKLIWFKLNVFSLKSSINIQLIQFNNNQFNQSFIFINFINLCWFIHSS